MKARLQIILSCIFMAVGVMAEDTKTISVTFIDFAPGNQYAENERHDLDDGLVLYTTKCHFTTEIRIYSSTTYNGYVVSDPLPGAIASLSFRMGYNKDVLNVYGSTDKENWTLVKGIETTSTSYRNYTLNFPSEKNYTCFKLDVKGDSQIRIESMSVTYACNDGGNDGDNDEGNDEMITVSAPIFTPGTSLFSAESLNVSIDVADGCEVYYTTDGTNPSYTTTEEYVGTKGYVATIHHSSSPVILKAIAVVPNTGQCSSISSATYTYVDPLSKNDGTKTRPYTVEEVAIMTGIKKGYWVKGRIYGTMVDYNIDEITTSDFRNTNIVIGNETTHIPVQLPSGDIRDEINLKNHPYLKGKEILIKGTLEEYCGSQGVKEPEAYEITYDIPINSFGYASLYLDMPASVPEGSTAYYCNIEDNYVNLLPVGTIIPENVGVIIKSAPNTTCKLDYTIEKSANKDSILLNNQLVGFTKDTLIVANDNAYYALNARNNQVGFYIPQTAIDDNDATSGFTAKAYKAYLQVPTEQKSTMFLLHREHDETAIEPIHHHDDDTIYDLQGRIVSSPTTGIYIKAGRKIVIEQ